MSGIKLFLFSFVLVSLAITANSAPSAYQQQQQIQDLTLRLLTLRFKGRSTSSISQKEALDAVFQAFDNEIQKLQREKNVRSEDLDWDTINRVVEQQAAASGLRDPTAIKSAKKVVEMLALKYDGRSDQPSQEEMFEATKQAMENEIKRLEGNGETETSSQQPSTTPALTSEIAQKVELPFHKPNYMRVSGASLSSPYCPLYYLMIVLTAAKLLGGM